MDDFRKQLDQLMGSNRNGDKPQVAKHYTDDDVCKAYLCAVCPNDLFGNTKMDLGECPKLHSEPMKAEYEEAKKGGRTFPFEHEVEKYLETFVSDCDKKIAKAMKRLEETQGPEMPKLPEQEQQSGLGEIITEQVNQLYKQAERLGEEGKVDESMELLKKAEELKEKRLAEQAAAERTGAGRAGIPTSNMSALASVPAPLIEALGSNLTSSMAQQQQQKLRVCDICASLLSIYDSDRRLADHFGGKLHLGYMLLREKVQEMRGARERGRDRDRDRSRDKERVDTDRRRDSSRDYDREGRGRVDRPADRPSDRNRDSDRDRGSDRGSDRGYDRGSDRGSDRGRSSREYDRDRSRR